MECWTWDDAFLYFLCTAFSICWYLPPLGIFFVLLKIPLLIFIELPFSIIAEFKIFKFERRHSNRTFSTLYEYSAIVFIRWVLSTFKTSIIRKVFFGEHHARILFAWRRIKYGTENIGDFEYHRTPANLACKSAEDTTPRGYWVRSKSRLNSHPDLVIYFVPGNMSGASSPYLYLEYLAILLVELQVQGFRNPVIFCIDLDPQEYADVEFGFAAAIRSVNAGWEYVLREHPKSKTMFMGSGIGGTMLMSLLLHTARPFITVNFKNSLLVDSSGTPVATSSTVETTSRMSMSSSTPNSTLEHSASSNAQPLQNFLGCMEAGSNISDFNQVESTHDSKKLINLNIEPNDDSNKEVTDDAVQSILKKQYYEDHIISPRKNEPNSFVLTNDKTELVPVSRKPDALLLISPLMRVAMARNDVHPDFITAKCLNQLSRAFVKGDEENSLWTMPGCVRDSVWWSEALPSSGSVFMYGGLETLHKEMKQFLNTVKAGAHLKVIEHCLDEEIHSWPIMKAFLARTSTDQLDGITRLADHVANMLVMDCLCADTGCK